MILLDADAEALVIGYLAAELTARGISATVSDRVPATADRDDEHVRVVRTGGGRRDLVTDQAQLTIDVRAGSPDRAADLSALVRGLILDMACRVVGGSQVYAVGEWSGPYSNPAAADPYRYSQSVLLDIRSGQIA